MGTLSIRKDSITSAYSLVRCPVQATRRPIGPVDRRTPGNRSRLCFSFGAGDCSLEFVVYVVLDLLTQLGTNVLDGSVEVLQVRESLAHLVFSYLRTYQTARDRDTASSKEKYRVQWSGLWTYSVQLSQLLL